MHDSFFLYLPLQSSESIPSIARGKKSIFASGTFRYSFGELVLCVFVKMVKIFLLYLLCLFIVEIRHEAHIVTAGVVGSICLLLGRIVGENMEKGNNGQFLADAAFVKRIRRKS